ncbi:MAG: DEAD/DEAH box helicase family protein, partial [Giesbergeria sp.]
MRIKFKTQAYQTAAVEAVVDCFEGQAEAQAEGAPGETGNAPLQLSDAALLQNIRQVQTRQNLPPSSALAKAPISGVQLDVEMETGTGKTYCYIKTLFELNARYGWSKFIIVVPSIAIREGVASSLQATAGHFLELYRKRARFFIYSSRQLHQIESFASDAGIQIMVINAQAFAARGADNRRIYEEQDDFQSRRPMDVLRATRPILILDEPQKMEGAATLQALEQFHALMVLRYSATHKTLRHLVHRLDALDAYKQKLVKKIAVRGISVRGLGAGHAYLYLKSLELSPTKAPQASVEFEQKLGKGAIRRVVRKLTLGDNLLDLSNALDAYRGYVAADIDARSDTLSFSNGVQLAVGEALGDASETTLRRLQIREAIGAHLDKEQSLFRQGIKVLSLFFVDEVAKYRDYSAPEEKGEYARMFEEAYREALAERLGHEDTPYTCYLRAQDASAVHSGYFSIDRKTRHWIDP